MMAGKMHAPTIDDEIQEAFKIFDRQSKGYITKNDIRYHFVGYMRRFHRKLSIFSDVFLSRIVTRFYQKL